MYATNTASLVEAVQSSRFGMRTETIPATLFLTSYYIFIITDNFNAKRTKSLDTRSVAHLESFDRSVDRSLQPTNLSSLILHDQSCWQLHRYPIKIS